MLGLYIICDVGAFIALRLAMYYSLPIVSCDISDLFGVDFYRGGNGIVEKTHTLPSPRFRDAAKVGDYYILLLTTTTTMYVLRTSAAGQGQWKLIE